MTSIKNMEDYKDKLNDPRWKEKRNRILERDDLKCQACGSRRELHVHHFKYHGQPWDVKDSSLITLCARCHRIEEAYRKSDTQLTFLSKETLIPCIVLSGLLTQMERLKRQDVTDFHAHIKSFFDAKISSIRSKSAKQSRGGREVKPAGIGGRLKYADTNEIVL